MTAVLKNYIKHCKAKASNNDLIITSVNHWQTPGRVCLHSLKSFGRSLRMGQPDFAAGCLGKDGFLLPEHRSHVWRQFCVSVCCQTFNLFILPSYGMTCFPLVGLTNICQPYRHTHMASDTKLVCEVLIFIFSDFHLQRCLPDWRGWFISGAALRASSQTDITGGLYPLWWKCSLFPAEVM